MEIHSDSVNRVLSGGRTFRHLFYGFCRCYFCHQAFTVPVNHFYGAFWGRLIFRRDLIRKYVCLRTGSFSLFFPAFGAS